jgi:hypothetical protein
MIRIILFFSLSVTFASWVEPLLAQSNVRGWTLTVSAGLSNPVGAFKSNDPVNSLSVDNQGQQTWAGFKKEGNAAARLGSGWNLDVSRELNKRWRWSVGLAFAHTRNEVETESMEQYLTQQLGTPLLIYQIEQRAYQVSFYQFLVARRWCTDRFFGSVGLLAGMAVLQYPLYEVNRIHVNSGFESPLVHRGFMPTSKSFTGGISIDLGIRISPHWEISLRNRYQWADFLYEKGGRFVGASSGFVWVDTVTYRALITTMNVCFRFD